MYSAGALNMYDVMVVFFIAPALISLTPLPPARFGASTPFEWPSPVPNGN